MKNKLLIFGSIIILIIMFKDKILSFFGGGSAIKGNAKEGFDWVVKKYGKEYAQKIEQLFRNETAHFKSSQWLKCGTAGLVATTKVFPYGWSSLRDFAKEHNLKDSFFDVVYFSNTSDGKPRYYVKFSETKYSVMFTAWFLKTKRNGNIYAWYSLNSSEQSEYKKRLDTITPIFTA